VPIEWIIKVNMLLCELLKGYGEFITGYRFSRPIEWTGFLLNFRQSVKKEPRVWVKSQLGKGYKGIKGEV